MILELTAASAGAYGVYRYLFRDEILQRKVKQLVIEKWNTMIELTRNTIENKGNQRFEILKVIPKYYGFDAIISLPLEFTKLRSLLPTIESTFGGEAIVELSQNKQSAYLRILIDDYETIKELDYITFKWYKSFSANKYRNTHGQTYNIVRTEEVKNPNNSELVGYKLLVVIPTELNYDELEKEVLNFNETWQRKIFARWNRKLKMAEIVVIFSELSDDEKFVPVKTGEYEFYVGMSYEYKPILVNFQYSPHLLYTGKSQTGKTVCVMMGLCNMAYHYDEDVFLLYESMISAKQDLRIFANLKQCQYYANNIEKSYKLFKHIDNIMHERNKVFESSKQKFVINIFDWNKKNKDKKMPLIILAVDEMTVYMPKDSDSKDVKQLKKACLSLLWNFMIEGASAGINVIFSLQRPDRESFPPQLKSQISSKICFFQPTTAASLTAIDSEICTKLAMKREAVVSYSEGEEFMKTLYLTPDMILKLLKDKMVKDKKYIELDNEGNIIKLQKESKDTSITSPSQPTEHEQKQNNRKDTYFKNKTLFKRSGE